MIIHYLIFISFLFSHTFCTPPATINVRRKRNLPETTVPLFKAHPKVYSLTPHQALGNFPTPLHKLENLGTQLHHTNIFIKRDDASSDLFGGHILRKLEFILGDALELKAKGILTIGPAGSNHTCATAVFANKCGIPCILLHTPQLQTAALRRNLLLSKHYGAQLKHYRKTGERTRDTPLINQEFKEKHKVPLYYIPLGGSNEFGCMGFVNAAFELKEQITQGGMPEPDVIYMPISSAGSAAGLALGLKACGLKATIIAVNSELITNQEKALKKLFQSTNRVLHTYDETFPIFELKPEDVIINNNFIGKGIAHIPQTVKDAMMMLEQTEQIKLDGTYTGKAFAALLDDVINQKLTDKVVLFWNTFKAGDLSEIIKQVDYRTLPKEYYNYFTLDLQDTDLGV